MRTCLSSFTCSEKFLSEIHEGGGSSPIAKVPGDVRPAKVYFWSKKCQMLVIPVKKPNFLFWSRESENLASFVKKTLTRGTFGVETSLAKGIIIFTKIGPTNCATLKL